MSKVGERISVAGVAMSVVAVGVFGWIGYELSRWPAEPPAAASVVTRSGGEDAQAVPSAEPSPTPTRPARDQRVALLSDGLAISAGSWFERVIRAEAVDGLVLGAVASEAGQVASGLQANAPRTQAADVVVVQAGTVDLLNQTPPQEVAASLEGLLQTVIDLRGEAGPEVVWVTVPPMTTQPGNVLAVNREVTAWAEANDVTVWDLTTPVATPEGAWKPGLSVDGIAANEAGHAAQARAARAAAQEFLAG